MASIDPVTNLAESEVSTTYNDTDTSIILSAGGGAKLPDPDVDGEYNLVWWNYTDYPNPAEDPKVEFVRVTGPAGTGNTKTVTRGQEGISASTKNAAGKTYKIALAFTKLTYDIIKASILKVDGIEDSATADQTASEVPIVDGGSIITATNVEDALAENRTAINLNTAKNTNATHTGDVTGSEELTIGADKVKDTHIDWGVGANQVSSCDVPDHDGHTVRDTFVHIVNRGVAEAITITLTGGLNFSWTAGEIYDRANHTFVTTEAGSGSVTDNAVNYLKWVSGTTLTVSTSDATGDEVLIAIGSVYNGNINGYREMSLLDESLANIRRCARAVFPTRVISGMSVHEDTDVTNPLDVTMDAGVFCKELQEGVTPIEIKSRNTAMVRNFHTAGVWDSDTNAQIETANYDNGTQLTVIPGGKYVKGLFIYMNGKIGFVYPREYFNTIAQAQNAALPAMPTGLESVPKLTAIVYQQGDTNFTGAIWQDVRTGISEQSFSGVTDHGALAGLSDDDHTLYLLESGARALAGALDLGGQNLTNGGNITASFIGNVTGTASNNAIITSNSYVGDDSVNRAIPHGLGVIPKIVILIINYGASGYIRLIESGHIHYIDTLNNTYYTVTAWDSTNFYVGDVTDYKKSGNEYPVSYSLVAIG